jgi:hypothetical protein
VTKLKAYTEFGQLGLKITQFVHFRFSHTKTNPQIQLNSDLNYSVSTKFEQKSKFKFAVSRVHKDRAAIKSFLFQTAIVLVIVIRIV